MQPGGTDHADRCALFHAVTVVPNTRRNQNANALGLEKPSRSASSASERSLSRIWRCAN
jgi:hypothetical protein